MLAKMESTMANSKSITLDSTVCPACAVVIPKRNKGCPHCAYTFGDNADGRVGTLREMMSARSEFNNVSAAFLALFAAAATAAP